MGGGVTEGSKSSLLGQHVQKSGGDSGNRTLEESSSQEKTAAQA